jgi:hypothetical protein
VTAARGDPDSIVFLASLPELPADGAYLWGWFADPATGLHATRQSSGMGPSRLSRLEIRLWERDEGVALKPWERRCLMAIDSAWLRSLNDEPNDSGGDR